VVIVWHVMVVTPVSQTTMVLISGYSMVMIHLLPLLLEVMMTRWKTSIDYSRDDTWFKFSIYIPNSTVPPQAMKSALLKSGNSRLAVLDYAREMCLKEALWYSCPDWDLDYGICSSPTSPLGGNGDTPDV